MLFLADALAIASRKKARTDKLCRKPEWIKICGNGYITSVFHLQLNVMDKNSELVCIKKTTQGEWANAHESTHNVRCTYLEVSSPTLDKLFDARNSWTSSDAPAIRSSGRLPTPDSSGFFLCSPGHVLHFEYASVYFFSSVAVLQTVFQRVSTFQAPCSYRPFSVWTQD